LKDLKKINLELFGQNFPITTADGTLEDLRKISEYYKHVILGLQKKFPQIPHLNIAVLAGLMITDDLYNLSKSKTSNFTFDEKKADDLINEAIKQLEVSLKL